MKLGLDEESSTSREKLTEEVKIEKTIDIQRHETVDRETRSKQAIQTIISVSASQKLKRKDTIILIR